MPDVDVHGNLRGCRTLWGAAFRRAFFGVNAMHYVGLEIEILKSLSYAVAPLYWIVMSIEDTKDGVMGAGEGFATHALQPLDLNLDQLMTHLPEHTDSHRE